MPYKGTPEERREKHRIYIANRYRTDEEYRSAHKKRVKDGKPAIIQKLKLLIDSFRASGCNVCGEMDPCCLDAHHVDPGEKEFEIASAIGNARYSKKSIVSELEKCVCLCSNCHRKLHAGRFNL